LVRLLDVSIAGLCVLTLFYEYLQSPGRVPGPVWRYPTIPPPLFALQLVLFGWAWVAVMKNRAWGFVVLGVSGLLVLGHLFIRDSFPFSTYQYRFGTHNGVLIGSIVGSNNDHRAYLFAIAGLYCLVRFLFTGSLGLWSDLQILRLSSRGPVLKP
jgi:hypothetical protein